MNDNRLPAKSRLDAIESRFRAAARESSARRPCLIGVTKTHDAAAIAPYLEAGLTDIGENRIQEALGKLPALKARFPGLKTHLIGPLQSNKAGDAAEWFDCVHTIDRPKIVHALDAACAARGRRMDVFIQVNIGREAQKSGVAIERLPELVARVRESERLDLLGLMAVPPQGAPAGTYFAFLAELARREGLHALSMGMSGDYGTAIQLGATHVRIGTALFGER